MLRIMCYLLGIALTLIGALLGLVARLVLLPFPAMRENLAGVLTTLGDTN